MTLLLMNLELEIQRKNLSMNYFFITLKFQLKLIKMLKLTLLLVHKTVIRGYKVFIRLLILHFK